MSGSTAPSGGGHPVLVQVAAVADQVPVLRTVVADLASRADFDLDTVEDLRLAVDEAAAELVGLARPGGLLTATFSLSSNSLEVTVGVGSRPGATVKTSSFGWRVLSTLADGVDVRTGEDADGSTVAIVLCKTQHDDLRSANR